MKSKLNKTFAELEDELILMSGRYHRAKQDVESLKAEIKELKLKKRRALRERGAEIKQLRKVIRSQQAELLKWRSTRRPLNVALEV